MNERLRATKARLEREIEQGEADVAFWGDDMRDAKFGQARDGGPMVDVTEQRLAEMRNRLERDRALLADVNAALRQDD